MPLKDYPDYKIFELTEGSSAIDIAKLAFAKNDKIMLRTQVAEAGLYTPSTQIYLGRSFFAASVFPHLSKLETSDGTKYYAFMPLDYCGAYSAPSGGKEISDPAQIELIYRGLHLNGHTTPSRINIDREMPKPLPEDFDHEKHPFYRELKPNF